MSTDWDLLIENHFDRKNENKLTLETLMESINEVMSTLPIKDDYLLTEDEPSGKRFSMSIPIPRLMPSEAWGDPSSQSRQEVDRVFASITRKGGNMKSRIQHVATFLDPAQAMKKAPGGKVNTVLNMMQIIEALQAALNDFNESSAGFVFEGFMAALTGGRQEAGRVGGTLPIEDFITADNENVSLKLLSPATQIHGSFTNLIDYLFLRGKTGVPSIKYLVAYKDSEEDAVAKLQFWEFYISRDNLVELFEETGNGGLFGSVASQFQSHAAAMEDSNEWRLRMKEILSNTGYNPKLGMFFKNLTPEGEFFVADDAGPDPEKKAKDFRAKEKLGRKVALVDQAEEAGAESYQSGKPIETWLKDINWSKHPDLPKGLKSKARKVLMKQIKIAWDKGFNKAKEEDDSVVAESYFGAFHKDEKRSLLQESTSGSGGKQFHISGNTLLAIKSIAGTTVYGILDMSQNNIDELVKIYVEKLGEDLISLLENTKNFSENIGRYFSADDRSEAATANRTAREQGEEIVNSLEERAKEEV
tara:strand:+ start:872 stop:2464 length:1593 start_codon:yes stop_codon:yes gene_type:complete